MKSIGTVTMRHDRSLELMLRAESPDMLVLGDAAIVYSPRSPGYDEVVAHVGGLVPGETKTVPPFGDQ